MDRDREAMELARVSDLFGQPAPPLARLRELEADLEEFDRLQAASEGTSGLAPHAAHMGMLPRRIPTRGGRRPECVRHGAGRS